jgi:hypothetical protein
MDVFGSDIVDLYDIMSQGLIGLIEYSYYQSISSFPEVRLQRNLG